MMVGTRKRLLLAVPLAALALAGCGGGDDESEPVPTATEEAPTALSKEELLAQGDAICAEVNAAVGTVGSTSTGTEGQASQVADLYGGMAERLKGLGSPHDDEAGYTEFIAAAEALAQAQGDVSLAANRGEAVSEAESDAAAALGSFRSAATAYGFDQCGEAPRAPATRPEPGGGAPEGAPEASGEEEEAPPAAEAPEATPETGGAGSTEGGNPGGGAGAEGTGGAGGGGGSGGGSGGIGPG